MIILIHQPVRNNEAKQHWVRAALGWQTARESLVLLFNGKWTESNLSRPADGCTVLLFVPGRVPASRTAINSWGVALSAQFFFISIFHLDYFDEDVVVTSLLLNKRWVCKEP